MLSEQTIKQLQEERIVQQLVTWLNRATLEEKLALVEWLVAVVRGELSPQDAPIGLIKR